MLTGFDDRLRGRFGEAELPEHMNRRRELLDFLDPQIVGLVQHAPNPLKSGNYTAAQHLVTSGGSYPVPPTVSASMRSVGWPTPTGTLWPSLPHVPTPVSSAMSLPIIETRVNASGPLPISVAPFTG